MILKLSLSQIYDNYHYKSRKISELSILCDYFIINHKSLFKYYNPQWKYGKMELWKFVKLSGNNHLQHSIIPPDSHRVK